MASNRKGDRTPSTASLIVLAIVVAAIWLAALVSSCAAPTYLAGQAQRPEYGIDSWEYWRVVLIVAAVIVGMALASPVGDGSISDKEKR